MGMHKILAAAAFAATGAFGVADAEAGDVGVHWSVTFGSPFYAPPLVLPPPVLFAPLAPIHWPHGYHPHHRRDRDGDGIPNRYDHRYTPRWDRDGDGVPNRYDRHPDGRHGWQAHSGGNRAHDGYGGHDARDRDRWGGGRGGHGGRGRRGD